MKHIFKLTKKQKIAGRLNYILASFYLPATRGDLLDIYSASRRPGLRAGSLDKNPNMKRLTKKPTTI
ncbi:MAG: hypothetical protein AN490_02040 [Anabaena sp. AL09]|nr:MAG: hypothetical protein AN490_02040 [Anabaena sp. AL09]